MADNLDIIKCPACENEMQKVYMPEQGVNIDVCTHGCGGIYFDNREFKQFDEAHENIDKILEVIEGKKFAQTDEVKTRLCPVCGAPMVKNHSSYKQEIQIDECYTCGGKFLDNKELIKFRAEYATEAERSEDMIASVYSTVGIEIRNLEIKNELNRMRRSPLKRLFDSLIYKN